MAHLSPGAGVALGIIVGLVSTCIQSIGLTLQRKSHMLEDSKEEWEPRRAPFRRRRWQVGMLLFLLANIVGSTIQITTLPLPLLSTLQASGLVFNSLMAALILKESWTWRTGAGTVLVAGGAVLISLFSALPEPSHNLQQLLALLRLPAFLAWFLLSLLFVLAVLVLDFSLKHFIPVHRRGSPKVCLVRGMAYGLISGILSAHALLLAKSAVELIVRSLADKVNQFRGYQSWLLIVAFLVLALTQLYYLHLGLRLVSTSVLYPFVFCIYNIVAILDGLIYFKQMDRLPPLHAGLIALGTVILLSGVLALSWRLQDEEGEDDEHQHLSKAEIPQTVLAPGMGFVGDPEDDTDTYDSSALTDEDYESVEEEETALVGKHKRKSTTDKQRSMSPHLGRRRKRAATLKEVRDIWQELGDSNVSEARYGTFAHHAHPSGSHSRPATAGHERQRRRRRSSGGQPLEGGEEGAAGDAGEESDQGLDGVRRDALRRAKTTPPPSRHSRSSKRRRRSGTHSRPQGGGGALFGDMLKMEWWRGGRKSGAGDDEGGAGGGRAREPEG